jgi:hypothetical protein
VQKPKIDPNFLLISASGFRFRCRSKLYRPPGVNVTTPFFNSSL